MPDGTELFMTAASAAKSLMAAELAAVVNNSEPAEVAGRHFGLTLRGPARLVPPRLSLRIRSTYLPRLSDGTRVRPSLTNPQMSATMHPISPSPLGWPPCRRTR